MRRLLLPLLLGLLLLLPLSGVRAAPYSNTANEVHVWVRDNVFNPPQVKIPVGGEVVFHIEARAVHTITADDGSWDSGNLKRGETYRVRFDKAGRFTYYCKPHGSAGGHGMAGLVVVGDPESAAPEGVAPHLWAPRLPRTEGPKTLHVPADFPTVQAAVDAAYPKDMILVAPGVYHEAVVIFTPELTVRGEDRNGVIFDGKFELDNAFKVLGADGVVLENMTARYYQLNGFFWTSVKGFRGSYLTAYNSGVYGIYAFDSQEGQFDHAYASGHPDSGFYIGQCKPCNALITDVISEWNGLAYSGTNAGGELYLMNSVWRHNWGGITPNTLDTELLAPQVGAQILNNVVEDTGNPQATYTGAPYSAHGIGITLAGGQQNIVAGNTVRGSATFGIATVPNVDLNFWLATGNKVELNRVSDSGLADLALGGPAGAGNCFSGNAYSTAWPPTVESTSGCTSALARLGFGDPLAVLPSLGRMLRWSQGDVEPPDWKDRPIPGPQPNMPDVTGPAKPAFPTPEWEAAKTYVASLPAASDPVGPAFDSSLGVFRMAAWWVTGFSLYLYLLPFVLYCAWVTLALWDLLRQDGATGRRIGWMAVVLLIPFLGPIAYWAVAKSPISRSLRFGLVGVPLVVYLGIALLLVSVAPVG